MYVRKVLGFCCFCFVAAFFFACSDDLLVSIGSDKVEVNDDLKAPVNLVVETRFRDSVLLKIVGDYSYENDSLIKAGKSDLIEFPQFKNPELYKGAKNYLEQMSLFLKEFYLHWGAVEGAVGYEVRVSIRPITIENWLRAEKVRVKSTEVSDGIVKAIAAMEPYPSVYSSRCVNCKSCHTMCPTAAISMIDRKAVIDNNLCIECGVCFRSCDYDAIGGSFAGTAYYFAVRAYDSDSLYSFNVSSTDRRYKLRYVSFASIADSLLYESTSDYWVKGCLGCAGNCTDGSQKSHRKIKKNPCFVTSNKTCPVEAVYEVDSMDIERLNTQVGAMFIDFDKCINCGECARICYMEGGNGAIVTEMIEVP